MKLGVFGGTFDPVHETHLALARLARERAGLDLVLFVPAPDPPHKAGACVSYEHRAAMLDLALGQEAPALQCSRIEAGLPRPSYTVRTVEALMHKFGLNSVYLLAGLDSLAGLPAWYQAEKLVRLAHLVVANRDEAKQAEIERLVSLVRPAYKKCGDDMWRNACGKTIRVLSEFSSPFSSTAIRAALAEGLQPAGLVPAVFAFIKQHGLYGVSTPGKKS